MPELIVVAFDDALGAESAKLNLRHLPKDQLLLVEQALAVAEPAQADLELHTMRRHSSVLVSLPRALVASALAGVFFTAAWGLAAAGMISGALLRNRQPMDRRAAQALQAHLSEAPSALVLIVTGSAPEEMLATIGAPHAKVVRTQISAENATALKRHLRGEQSEDEDG